MRAILLSALASVCVTASASAAPMVDFSLGTLGSLGTPTITVDGLVKVDVFAAPDGSSLYRWRGEHCCDHVDAGFGVLRPGEAINPAEPELNPGELLRLSVAPGWTFTAIYFSSLNNAAQGQVYRDIYPAGVASPFSALEAASDHTLRLPVTAGAKYLWVVPTGPLADNFFLVHGVDLTPVETVPEPGTLALLGAGLLGVVRRCRRRA